MEKDNPKKGFWQSDLCVPLCGLFIGLMAIIQSILPRPQWQKDSLLAMGIFVLVVDIVLLMMINYKKDHIKKRDESHVQHSGTEQNGQDFYSRIKRAENFVK